jgi:hypothetical protein
VVRAWLRKPSDKVCQQHIHLGISAIVMPMQLRRIQLEARALQAVQAVLAGGRVEDDLIECKADWPDESKVRQLAAHANAARGDPIIWLIGVDENSHQVTTPRDIDPADWWPVMSKRFDEVSPDLLHTTVHLDGGKIVVVLAFTTDQAPYVITTGTKEGRVEREVPMRVATGTRSAHRHDLLLMLAPLVKVPKAVPIKVTARADVGGVGETYPFSLEAMLFFEHSGTHPVMLPAHQMWARVEFDTRHLTSDLPLIDMPISHSGMQGSEPFGVQQTRDGVVVSGPGSLEVYGSARIEPERMGLLIQATPLQARLSFGVAGSDRRVELPARLYRTTPAAAQKIEWRFEELTINPWLDQPAP